MTEQIPGIHKHCTFKNDTVLQHHITGVVESNVLSAIVCD